MAEELERIPSTSKKRLTGNQKALLEEIQTARLAIFGEERLMPSTHELRDAGFHELVHAITAFGKWKLP